LRVDDPRERLGEIDVAPIEVQDRLLGRTFLRQRSEIDVDMPHRTSKLVDIGKTKYLRRQARLGSIIAHRKLLKIAPLQNAGAYIAADS